MSSDRMSRRNPSRLLSALVSIAKPVLWPLPSALDAEADIHSILQSFDLQNVRRFFNQRHWEIETAAAEMSDAVEPGLKLENVAAHSWHVAEAALLLAPHFRGLDLTQTLAMALLHDKLEMLTGDFDPVGPDGTGRYAHSFNPSFQEKKETEERLAIQQYVGQLRSSIRGEHETLLKEVLFEQTAEAKFVRAVDKLLALAFVHIKKNGKFTDEHLVFSIRYSRKAVDAFPGLYTHYACLLGQVLDRVSQERHCSPDALDQYLIKNFDAELRAGACN